MRNDAVYKEPRASASLPLGGVCSVLNIELEIIPFCLTRARAISLVIKDFFVCLMSLINFGVTRDMATELREWFDKLMNFLTFIDKNIRALTLVVF